MPRALPTLPNLDDYVEWGGRTWIEQVRRGLAWLGPVEGLRVLDLGTRYGGMSILFAHLGATVVGVDIDEDALDIARQRGERAGVGDRVTFQRCSGAPNDLPGGFDVVFVKSVLVLADDLDASMAGIHASLVASGRLLLVENAQGGLPVRLVRNALRRSLHPWDASYFTRAHEQTVRRWFDVQLERWTRLPPTVLIGATKR